MGKIGGGFWPFLAGKRAGSDSEVLATLSVGKEESSEEQQSINIASIHSSSGIFQGKLIYSIINKHKMFEISYN